MHILLIQSRIEPFFKMKNHFLYFLVILLASFNCTYKTHEEVFTEVNIDESNLPFVILNFDNDAIDIKESTELIFKLQNDKSNTGFIEYTFTLDGKSYTREGNGSNIAYYYITPEHYSDGEVLNLSFEGIVKSGTKSLADRLGAEFYMISGSWNVKIHAKHPEKITPNINLEEGRLIIRWEDINHDYQYRYKLNIEKTGQNEKHYESLEIKKSDSLFYFDDMFNGIKRKYWIDIISNWYSVSGDTVSFEIDPIKLDYYFLGHSHVVLKWDTIPFYNHNIPFSIKSDVQRNNDLSMLADSLVVYFPNFIYDSVLSVNIDLGYYVFEQKQYQEEHSIFHPCDITFLEGHRFDHFQNILYSDLTDKIVIIRSEYDGIHLFQINPNNRTIEIDNKLSYGGEYKLPTQSNLIFKIVNNNSSAVSLYTLNIENNYSSSAVNIEHLLKDGSWCVGDISYQTQEKIVFNTRCMSLDGQITKIYNIDSKIVEYVDSLGAIVLSTSGKFAYSPVTSELIKFINHEWKPVGNIELSTNWGSSQIWINNGGKEQLYIFHEQVIQLYEWDENLESNAKITLTKSFELPQKLNNPYFDHTRKLICGEFTKNEYYKDHIVLRPQDMEIIYRLEIENEVIPRLIKNTIYLSNGLLIDYP